MPWCPRWGWWTQQTEDDGGARPASGLRRDSFQPWEAAGAPRCRMKTSSLVSHLDLCWPGLRTATDLWEIIAPSAGLPLSAPEPHRDSRPQLMVSAIPSFPFLLYSLFYILLIWQFVCTCKNVFNMQSFEILFPSPGAAGQPAWLGRTMHGAGRRPVGTRENTRPGAGQSLSSRRCLWEHVLCIAVSVANDFFWYGPERS